MHRLGTALWVAVAVVCGLGIAALAAPPVEHAESVPPPVVVRDPPDPAAGASELAAASQAKWDMDRVRWDRAARSRVRPRPHQDSSGPSSNRAVGREMMLAYGFGAEQWPCLDDLWGRLEGGWSVTADNPNSSAYGIVQALPGSKMASALTAAERALNADDDPTNDVDWRYSPVLQIRWGLGYVRGEYGTPCEARSHRLRRGWY